MININNNIGKNIRYKILYKNQELSECKDILSLYDALCQIKKEKSNDYTLQIEVAKANGNIEKHTIAINSNGKFRKMNIPNEVTWTDVLDRQLLYLSGFTNNVIYENSKK